jgi:hypothetical protein
MSGIRAKALGGVIALLLGVNAAAASVTVTVSDGAVVVDPATLKLASTDNTIVFKLTTPGYVFPASKAVVITGAGSVFKCSNAANALEVSCRRAGPGSGGQLGLVVHVVPAPGTKATPPKASPNIWIQSD